MVTLEHGIEDLKSVIDHIKHCRYCRDNLKKKWPPDQDDFYHELLSRPEVEGLTDLVNTIYFLFGIEKEEEKK